MKAKYLILLFALWANAFLNANCTASRAVISNSQKTPGGLSPTPTPAQLPTLVPPMTLRYGVAQIPLTLDPHLHSVPELNLFLNTVYETLVYLNEDRRLEPSLAESWEISDDGLLYTFKLHAGITFHDGTRFDAPAVKQNLDRIASSATGSSKAASLLRGYEGSTVVDRYTIRVRLAQAYPTFLDALSQVYLSIASPTAFEQWGREEYQRHHVGTGPFRFSDREFVPGDTIVLEKNFEYNWGPVIYRNTGPRYVGSGHNPNSSCQQTHLVYDHRGPAYLDRVVFKAISDGRARADALETGIVDAADQLLIDDVSRWQREEKYWVTAVPILGTSEVNLSAANLRVNCLTFDVRGRSPSLYDVTLK